MLSFRSKRPNGLVSSALSVAVVSVSVAGAVRAAPVDLGTWTAESYPAVSGFPSGEWELSADNASVVQTANGQPTIFYSDFSARDTDVTGTLDAISGGDDDFIGFVLGFEPGDTASATADYLLVDWKRSTQSFNFSEPAGTNTTPGSNGLVGLAVSRVTGIPTADELWGHVNFSENPGGGVEELVRATTLGSSGWSSALEYDFRFVYSATNLEIYVDDVLEVALAGSFPEGRLGFYNFSQDQVRYSAFDALVVPEPGTAILLGLGLAGMGFSGRRRRSVSLPNRFN